MFSSISEQQTDCLFRCLGASVQKRKLLETVPDQSSEISSGGLIIGLALLCCPAAGTLSPFSKGWPRGPSPVLLLSRLVLAAGWDAAQLRL